MQVIPLKSNKCFPSAFTLVELRLVMGIIVLLVAMMFPVIIGAKDKARKKQALTEAHNIVLALKAYRMEYGKWPNQTQATNDTTYFVNNNAVIRELAGNNPRGRVFLAVHFLSTNIFEGVTNLTGQTDNSGNYVDPWGVPYVICMDEDMNGGCLINFGNVVYTNIFARPPTIYSYSATNYSVKNMEVAVASFAGEINAHSTTNTFAVETWSEPQ